MKIEILDSFDNVITEDTSDSNFSIYNSTDVEEMSTIPNTFAISLEPNPFVSYTVINYQIPVKSKVSLKIYDLTGSCVKILAQGLIQ